MKIARIKLDGATTIGIVEGDNVQPLTVTADLDELLMATPDERADLVGRLAEGKQVDLSSVMLLSPVQPRTLRDYITFEEHLEGSLKGLGMPPIPRGTNSRSSTSPTPTPSSAPTIRWRYPRMPQAGLRT